jgi:hypothetical protein
VFLGSITYLPIVLAVMTVDRGSISAEAFLRGRSEAKAVLMTPQPPTTPSESTP